MHVTATTPTMCEDKGRTSECASNPSLRASLWSDSLRHRYETPHRPGKGRKVVQNQNANKTQKRKSCEWWLQTLFGEFLLRSSSFWFEPENTSRKCRRETRTLERKIPLRRVCPKQRLVYFVSLCFLLAFYFRGFNTPAYPACLGCWAISTMVSVLESREEVQGALWMADYVQDPQRRIPPCHPEVRVTRPAWLCS